MDDFEIETLRRKNVGYASDSETRIQCGVLLSLIGEIQKARKIIRSTPTAAPASEPIARNMVKRPTGKLAN
jgi:hypothetical protein